MDAFNDSIFEKKYKNFLAIRKQWLGIIFQHAVYLDQNAQGEAYRPVAILTDKTVLAQAEDILLVWQQFVVVNKNWSLA
ncbi:hypothetical protein Xvie_03970 [Xenorhabdus vietnamensis]|uniref:Uncharacterized protein n=2 Tax=Xenorhabdus vietnamensis TaxID=351656 RepID=A0A1Y2S8W9_9GAMM|nr:hypothetical protein Xvie_03970 [Xenorhabdus vietnamensis]